MSNSAVSQKKSNKAEVSDAVSKLLKNLGNVKHEQTYDLVRNLKKKYGDDEIVDEIVAEFREKMKEIRKFATKIKERLMYKHPNLSMKEYIEKISKYQERYGLTNEQTQTIINMIFANKSFDPTGEGVDIGYNAMSKTLGFVPASYNLGEHLVVNDDELQQLDEILALNKFSKELHNQITLQSLIYKDCDVVAINTDGFDKNKVNMFSYVHPVIFALFMSKHDLLDSHMLLASISEIIRCKKEYSTIRTQPDYELYWDISTDPNETACTSKRNPMTDLLHRTTVQIELWKNVLNLRQGKYYTTDLNAFITAIDGCKSNVFDAADLINVKDEGTVLRKLFGAFSLRPIIVMTYPEMVGLPSITISTSHLSSMTTSQITTLPLVTVRIPMNVMGTSAPTSLELDNAITQRQLYFHHGKIIFKIQQIIYARELLVFYIHRKSVLINTSKITNPYSISFMPFALGGDEGINTTKVTFKEQIEVGVNNRQKFALSSVVYIQRTELNPHTCRTRADCSGVDVGEKTIGCGTYIRQYTDPALGPSLSSNWYNYAPIILNSSGSSPKINPLTEITALSSDDINNIEQKGTLYIYRSCNKYVGII